MLYIFIALCFIIPISMGIYTICFFKNFDEKKYKLYQKETIRPYIKLDSRTEMLICLCKEEKSLAEYYEIEKSIKFP